MYKKEPLLRTTDGPDLLLVCRYANATSPSNSQSTRTRRRKRNEFANIMTEYGTGSVDPTTFKKDGREYDDVVRKEQRRIVSSGRTRRD